MSVIPVGVPAQYHQWMYLLKSEVKQRDLEQEKKDNLDDIDRTPGRRSASSRLDFTSYVSHVFL